MATGWVVLIAIALLVGAAGAFPCKICKLFQKSSR